MRFLNVVVFFVELLNFVRNLVHTQRKRLVPTNPSPSHQDPEREAEVGQPAAADGRVDRGLDDRGLGRGPCVGRLGWHYVSIISIISA